MSEIEHTDEDFIGYSREPKPHNVEWSEKAMERIANKFGLNRTKKGGFMVEGVTQGMLHWAVGEACRSGGCGECWAWVERVGIEFFVRLEVAA